MEAAVGPLIEDIGNRSPYAEAAANKREHDDSGVHKNGKTGQLTTVGHHVQAGGHGEGEREDTHAAPDIHEVGEEGDEQGNDAAGSQNRGAHDAPLEGGAVAAGVGGQHARVEVVANGPRDDSALCGEH